MENPGFMFQLLFGHGQAAHRRSRLILRFLALALAVLPSAALAQDAVRDLGRTYTEWFYAQNYDALQERFSDAMLQALSENALENVRLWLLDSVGEATEVLEEAVKPLPNAPGLWEYVRVTVFTLAVDDMQLGSVLDVTWTLDGSGTIYGLNFLTSKHAEAPTEYLGYQTQTDMRLPFEGEWFVLWGGRSLGQNYHTPSAGQRFAYDFFVVRNNTVYSGSGSQNDQYYCFGLPIVAPGDGVIYEAVDGFPDNRPGEMDSANPLGNHVILDHENGEYSFLVHFKQGSVQVATGERVEAGQVIAQCGNSGNSSQAHLHYHLQNRPTYNRGAGLPIQFQDYTADGVFADRGEPVQFQFIESLPEAPVDVQDWALY